MSSTTKYDRRGGGRSVNRLKMTCPNMDCPGSHTVVVLCCNFMTIEGNNSRGHLSNAGHVPNCASCQPKFLAWFVPSQLTTRVNA